MQKILFEITLLTIGHQPKVVLHYPGHPGGPEITALFHLYKTQTGIISLLLH